MKRNKLILILGLAYCLAGGSLAPAAENPTEEESLVAAEVQKLFKVTPLATRLESPALDKVTDASIYDVEVTITVPDGSNSSTIRVIKGGIKVASLFSILAPVRPAPYCRN